MDSENGKAVARLNREATLNKLINQSLGHTVGYCFLSLLHLKGSFAKEILGKVANVGYQKEKPVQERNVMAASDS